MMDQAAFQSFQVCETSSPEQFGLMVFTTVTNDFNHHDDRRNEPQTSLHSRKEQKRRFEIKTCCQHLCQLLPFVNNALDTATTLELTVKYITYLKDVLPPHILSKAIETLEKKSNSPNNRKPTLLKITAKKTKPTKKSNNDVCLRRSCYQRILQKEILPTFILTNPPLKLPNSDTQTIVRASPTLLDKSTVPWGQMLPMFHNQSEANCVQNTWMEPPSSSSSQPTMSNHFVSQMNKDPTLGHVLVDGRCSEDEAPGTFEQLYNAEFNHLMTSGAGSVPSPSPHSVPDQDFINQLFTSPDNIQSSSSSTWNHFPGSETAPEPVFDSRLIPENDFGLLNSVTDTVSPFSPVTDTVSPFSPVTDTVSPFSPVTDTVSPFSPVTDTVSPFSPVTDTVSPFSPVTDTVSPFSPVTDTVSPFSPVTDTVSPFWLDLFCTDALGFSDPEPGFI